MSVMLRTLVVRNPDTMEAVALVEGTDLPEWAVDLVHQDDVGSGRRRGKPAESKPAPKPDDGPPPMAGAGSGTDAWIAYARSFDPPVEVADDAKREDVVAAVQAAGHPVEKPQQ